MIVDFQIPGSPARRYAADCLIHHGNNLWNSGIEKAHWARFCTTSFANGDHLVFFFDDVPPTHWTRLYVQKTQQEVHFQSCIDEAFQQSEQTKIITYH